MDERTVVDWGQSPQVAPSIKRADALGWLSSSFWLGLLSAFACLAALWGPMPLLDDPPGRLPEHAACALKSAAHKAIGLFGADASYCALAYERMGEASLSAMRERAGFALAFFFLPGALLARSAFKGRDGLIHLRGSTRTRGEEAKRALNRTLAKRAKRRPDHEIAPGIVYPADMWTRHVLIVGGTGSGKSTAMKPLIDKIVRSGEQVLLYDPKSEFTMGFAKPQILAPWDARSLSWDIAKDMRNPLDMRRFAASMIKESQDPMWSNASRQLLVGLMIYLKRTRGDEWGWLELRELIALPQAGLLSIMERFHPEAIRAVEKASVTTAGILINLASFCSSIFDLAEAWGDVPPSRRVSFVEWTLGRSPFKQIILQGHGAYGELTKHYVEAIVGIFSAMVNSVEMEDDPKRKIWFVADECAQFKAPIRPLFEVGRSRGVRCVFACQDFAQLEELYGAPMVKALMGMCGTLLVGQISQGETAESLCKAFGAREVERANYSSSFGAAGNGPGRSTTLSYTRDEVPLYKPSELSSRLGLNAEGAGVTMLLFTGGHGYELEWPLFEIKRARAPHVPAAWTTLCRPGVLPSASAASPPEPESLAGKQREASVAPQAVPPAQGLASVGEQHSQPPLEPEATEPAPRAEVEVRAEPAPVAASAAEPEQEPVFDALAELAAMKLGAPLASMAIEAAGVAESAAGPRDSSRQTARVVQASKRG